MIETSIIAPFLLALIFFFIHVANFSVSYMSMSALAHESAAVSSQTQTPSAAALVTPSAIADEAGYRMCLDEIREGDPTESCLVGVAQWRGERLLRSLRLEETLHDFSIETRYEPSGGESTRPQLEVQISGTLNDLPGLGFGWGLSAQAVGALRD